MRATFKIEIDHKGKIEAGDLAQCFCHLPHKPKVLNLIPTTKYRTKGYTEHRKQGQAWVLEDPKGWG